MVGIRSVVAEERSPCGIRARKRPLHTYLHSYIRGASTRMHHIIRNEKFFSQDARDRTTLSSVVLLVRLHRDVNFNRVAKTQPSEFFTRRQRSAASFTRACVKYVADKPIIATNNLAPLRGIIFDAIIIPAN